MKLVSVIIPAYNQAQYVGKAIQSVLDQSYPHLECVVVDDGSKDHTYKIVKQFTDKRILYIRQLNQGLSAARNTGIKISTGDYLSFLDSDDLFTPDKLSLLIEEFEKDENLALAAGSAYLIDQDGNAIKRKFTSKISEDPSQFLLGNPLHVGSVLLKRSWQEKVGLFDPSLRSYEDWDFWIRLALIGGKMKTIQKPVSYYRFHNEQMTRNREQMTHASFSVLEKVFSNADLSSAWVSKKDHAYSHAYLRAAANDFVSNHFTEGKEHLSKAFDLYPDLLENKGKTFLNQTIGWTELPKVSEPLAFLETVYEHFPSEIQQAIGKQKRSYLSQAAINLGFSAFHNNDLSLAYEYLKKGISYNPKWIFNRGVLSIIRKAIFAPQQ